MFHSKLQRPRILFNITRVEGEDVKPSWRTYGGFGAFPASDGLVAIWWLTSICRNLTSCFLTWSKCCDCVLNSEWIPSIPCSPKNPRPVCHCRRNGRTWSSSIWSFGVIAMPGRFSLINFRNFFMCASRKGEWELTYWADTKQHMWCTLIWSLLQKTSVCYFTYLAGRSSHHQGILHYHRQNGKQQIIWRLLQTWH